MNRSDRDPDAYDRIRDDKLTSDFAEPMFGPAALVTVAQWNAVMADDQREGEPYMIAAGCRWLALAEAKAHWKNNAEARLKIELCEKEAKRRGWVK